MDIKLRKVKNSDKKYFAKWWRDENLLKLTSGILKRITDKEVSEYFLKMLTNKNDIHYIILAGRKIVGHIALQKRKNGWYETQIIIGEKNYQGKGYGTEAIKLLINKARRTNLKKIYLEVRPSNIRAIKAYEKCGFRKIGIKKYPKNKYLPQTLKMVLYKI
ncbi:MAG: GNAT family N-acetyltransferase [Candidatus Azambacteria bacterium]|nr:GNAT family N-acetyltransferase [Candidatus Azambacteria bacterium]